MKKTTVGFIGTGRISRAIVAGLVRNGNFTITGYDRDPDALASFCRTYNLAGMSSLQELAERSDTLILAVKPYQIEEVLLELQNALRADQLLISVAAGITTEFIRTRALPESHIIRVMPNTPSFVGEGMTALSAGKNATEKDLKHAGAVFSAVGRVMFLDEKHMDAVTAVSGSGPAYMFHIIESMARGGVACGLNSDDAVLLSAQTMLGAAKLLLESGKQPSGLIREVTTPGGTTEAGLKQMMAHDIRQAMIDTVKAAAKRSSELKQ